MNEENNMTNDTTNDNNEKYEFMQQDIFGGETPMEMSGVIPKPDRLQSSADPDVFYGSVNSNGVLEFTVADVRAALTVLVDCGESFDMAGDFGEPGYSKEFEDQVLMLVWSREFLKDYPEELRVLEGDEDVWYGNVDILFTDEWDIVDGLAYRIEPDSYHWLPSIVWCEEWGEYLSPQDNPEVILEHLVNNAKMALTEGLAGGSTHTFLIHQGFEPFREYQHPWNSEEDPPEKILKLASKYHDEVVFAIRRNNGMFGGMWYECWVRDGSDDDDDTDDDDTDNTNNNNTKETQ